MLDSPYVRRCAVSFRFLGLPYEHRSISVFRQFDAFAAVNPVVKAPTLVCDDGTVLMDSTLILQHAERISPASRSLVPSTDSGALHDLRVLGLALAACEKSVQAVYEQTLRPPEKRHDGWLDRVRAQTTTAFALLEAEAARVPLGTTAATMTQASLTTAVVWDFAVAMEAVQVDASACPALVAHSATCETLPEFVAAPPR